MQGAANFQLGDTVMIVYAQKDICVVNEMKQYNGVIAVVSKILRATGSNKCYMPYGYELDGIVSEKGVPFTFTKDMLIKVEDDDDI